MVEALLGRPLERTGRPTAVLQLLQGGHRFHYVRLLAENADAAPVVLLTTDEARASADFSHHLATLQESGQLLVESVGSATEPTRVLLRRAVDRAPAGAVLVLPDADRLLAGLAWLAVRRRVRRRRLPALRFLLMRTPELRARADHAARIAVGKVVLLRAVCLAWPASRALFLTDSWGVVDRRRGYGTATAVRDPSPGLPRVSRERARAELGCAPDDFVLGLLGGVSARKNPELTIEAMRSLPDDVVLLAAGEVAPEVRSSLASLTAAVGPGRVVVRDGYLTDHELACCVSACDVVVLTYDVDASSGLLVAAHDAGIPVLAAGSPWVCRVVSARGLGVVEDLSTAGVLRGVAALRRARVARPVGATAGPGAPGQSFAAAFADD